jgi:hypothetical protein
MSVYQSQQAVTTAAARRIAYRERIPQILDHADAFNITITKIELVAGNFVQFTTNAALSQVQLDHLQLDTIVP